MKNSFNKIKFAEIMILINLTRFRKFKEYEEKSTKSVNYKSFVKKLKNYLIKGNLEK